MLFFIPILSPASLARCVSGEGFEEKDGGVDVLLKDENPLHADMVILAIGVTPDTHLASNADTGKPWLCRLCTRREDQFVIGLLEIFSGFQIFY